MAGIAISGQNFCATNIIPSDEKWNGLGNDYIFEFDMKFVAGTDHNIAFRFIPATPINNWYELHFQSPGDFVLDRVGSGTYNVFIPESYPNGQTYHLKIIVNKNNIKVYINNLLMRDYTSETDLFPTGRIALRAGTGADPVSETYFDNIVVTSIDDILLVPYYSQNALPWGPTEYDSPSSLGIQNPTMDRWGCAVTSAAMVLNYHGMNQLSDGNPLDPGTLNDWLKSNNGYLTGTGTGGSYSYLLWPTISKLTKDLFDAGKATTKLEHKRAYPSTATTTLLNNDLLIRKIPDILQVQNVSTLGHFVVAKGLTNGVYNLNDPEWNVSTLASFGNTYSQVDRFVPSNTNLSYLVMVSNPGVELLVTDPFGRKTGKRVQNGATEEFNEIPDAIYAFENPISNPNEQNAQEQLGNGVNVFLLPQPLDGHYNATASSQTKQSYTVNIATFETDGTSDVTPTKGTVGPKTQDNLTIDYSQTQTSPVTKIITFQSTIDDINEARALSLITRDHVAQSLIRKTTQAQDFFKKGRSDLALKKLDGFEKILNRERGKNITEEAYQILLADVSVLKAQL